MNGHLRSSPESPRTDLLSPAPTDRVEAAPIYEGEVEIDKTVVVCGAGGFIGGHLVADLLRQGYDQVRAVDIKPPNQWFQKFPQADNRSLDLREKENCYAALEGADQVYNLAADMGGMGFIENNKALCMLSVRINTHLLMAARDMDIGRYFYSSSACVYNQELQSTADVEPLSEEDAYPALAEDGYGWEKLFSERMCRHFREDFGLTTRVARYHNVYGPFGTYDGGREKAPAALTRKAIEAKLSGDEEIVIWGDGTQTRSFMYADDCVKGTQKIMHSDITEPINLGSDELVTINGLVDVIEKAVEVDLDREYDLTKPQGVDGRNSDNTKILQELGWEPPTALRDGMEVTAEWIEEQIRRHAEEETTSRFAVAY
ncbi:nucleoside-diphosphate-sugar epimerase [Salinibacter ruber]|uniref:NAD-dependent epimerase/dehydratase family protein n=1 Tax=Salinibacter ruber TaxID=146919 RepID=UPI00216991FF|nr:NAD-dependent epimerase/dehydratase family protein [Salinibacter ruber]MCS3650102.1 nucleoside-diphosphate-sugar epimerase [Salinibacter ruber]MCS3653356.1 nucleoside-diphosphate-sugar epimerase [Salinibacter ruber]